MGNSHTASPDFTKQLGQLAKFYRVMGFTPEEIEVVIDNREARAILTRTWLRTCYPPAVKLVGKIFADEPSMSLTDRHRQASRLKLNDYLSALPMAEYNVLKSMLGLDGDEPRGYEHTGKLLGFHFNEVPTILGQALAKLRDHIEKVDRDLARRLPISRIVKFD